MERYIAGRYKLHQKLGSGAFGEIYYGNAFLTFSQRYQNW